MPQQLSIYNIKLTKGMNLDYGVDTYNPNSAYKLLNIKNQISGAALLDSLTNEKGTLKIFDSDDIENNNTISIEYSTALNNDGTPEDVKKLLRTGTIISVFKCTSQFSIAFAKNKLAVALDISDSNEVIDGEENNIENEELTNQELELNENDDVYKYSIFKIYLETELSNIIVTLLAYGDFNFGEYIDAVFCYENSELQKVYWVDGKNVLRYINTNKKEDDHSYITDSFYLDSTPEISYDHQIRVKKKYTLGVFSAGVILYAFTYYIANGPETPIVDYTPLYYITSESRGLKADETTMCSFEVLILNPDKRFDYIRLYAIQRTSLEDTPIVRIVKDIKINKDDDTV